MARIERKIQSIGKIAQQAASRATNAVRAQANTAKTIAPLTDEAKWISRFHRSVIDPFNHTYEPSSFEKNISYSYKPHKSRGYLMFTVADITATPNVCVWLTPECWDTVGNKHYAAIYRTAANGATLASASDINTGDTYVPWTAQPSKAIDNALDATQQPMTLLSAGMVVQAQITQNQSVATFVYSPAHGAQSGTALVEFQGEDENTYHTNTNNVVVKPDAAQPTVHGQVSKYSDYAADHKVGYCSQGPVSTNPRFDYRVPSNYTRESNSYRAHAWCKPFVCMNFTGTGSATVRISVTANWAIACVDEQQIRNLDAKVEVDFKPPKNLFLGGMYAGSGLTFIQAHYQSLLDHTQSDAFIDNLQSKMLKFYLSPGIAGRGASYMRFSGWNGDTQTDTMESNLAQIANKAPFNMPGDARDMNGRQTLSNFGDYLGEFAQNARRNGETIYNAATTPMGSSMLNYFLSRFKRRSPGGNTIGWH